MIDIELAAEIGRHFLFLLKSIDQADQSISLHDPGGLSSVAGYGSIELKSFLCHVASCAPVTPAQCALISDVFGEELTVFDVTTIGHAWQDTDVLFSHHPPYTFVSQAVRTILLSSARKPAVSSVGDIWIRVYDELGSAVAALGSTPSHAEKACEKYVDMMDSFVERHVRPYTPTPKNVGCALEKEQVRLMLENPGLLPSNAHFLKAHGLDAEWSMHWALSNMLMTVDEYAAQKSLFFPCVPMGFAMQLLADTGRILCTLATMNGNPSLDQVRFLRLFLAADLTLEQIEALAATTQFFSAPPPVLEGIRRLDEALFPKCARSCIDSIAEAVTADLGVLGNRLVALNPSTQSEVTDTIDHFTKLLNNVANA